MKNGPGPVAAGVDARRNPRGGRDPPAGIDLEQRATLEAEPLPAIPLRRAAAAAEAATPARWPD